LVAGPTSAEAGAASPTALLPVGPGLIHRWVALNQVPPAKVTPDQAAAVAPNFDLAVIKASEGALVHPMKDANADLTVLVYHNGSFAQKNQGNAFPEAWYAHDANGNKLQQTVFGNYLMDVSNPGWVGHVVHECQDDIKKTGADGCYTDMLMTAPLFGNYASGGPPVNPATGKKWTFPDYQAAVEAIADSLRAVPGPHGANGVANGRRWFATDGSSSKTLTDHVDGAHSEIWLRDRTLKVNEWPTVANWKLDVDMVVQAEAEQRVVMVETKLWDPASVGLTNRWRAFALASFLLGTEGKTTWYLFTSDRTFDGMTAAASDPWDKAPVGHPLGPYGLAAGGAYVRSFSTGFVAVNPGTTAVSVALPAGNWKSLTGTVQKGTVKLAAHTGSVWVPA
jgi:hypothetical protein